MSSERYDVVVDANQEPGNYWIKVRGLADCVNNGRFQTAILRYDRDSTDLPTPPVTTYADSAPSPPGLVRTTIIFICILYIIFILKIQDFESK